MRRLWVRWVLLIVFVAALGTAFVNLGEWQLDRLHQRRERNTATVSNEDRPVRPWAEVFTREPAKFQKATDALVARQAALAAAEDDWLTLEALREEAEG